MRYTVMTLAEIFDKDYDEMASILSANAKKLFEMA
jgi:Tat protein secretion system quality control protein TatD with DNase activity